MASASPTSGAKWRILCIDDDPEVLDVLSLTLGMKHEVIRGRDGMEGMGMLDLGEPDFVICDVRMPNMDGWQTVQAIRQHPRFHDIPVFFLTAEAKREDARKGFETGANLYLTKPFDPMRVLQNIDYFLKEHGLQPRPKKLALDAVERESLRLGETPAPSAAPAGRPRAMILCAAEPQLERFRAAAAERCDCVACADPLGSLQRLFRYDPDLMIINPAVPGLSGWGLVQMIRNNDRYRHLPILLIEDKRQPFDARLLPAITRFPTLPAGATPGDIQDAVARVLADPKFAVRPKRATIDALAAEEETLRRELDTERSRQRRNADDLKDRYGRIQTFIDHNMR